MVSRELAETALHVLVAWNEGRTPASADLAILRNAFPAFADRPPDELACAVINSFGRTVASERGSGSIDQVA